MAVKNPLINYGGKIKELQTGDTISSPIGANPFSTVGLTAINGSAVTFMRSDGAPALNQGITPTWTALHNFSKDANGPMITSLNGNRANYIEFSRTGYTPKVNFGALGAIEANISYNMDYADGAHRFYDSTVNAIWQAINGNGVYFQFAPLGATADIWYLTGSQYLSTQIVTGNATFSNGLTVGATIIKNNAGTDIGGNGNLLVGSITDPRYKVYINGIDSNGSLLAESIYGGIMDGKRTTGSASLGDNVWQFNGFNGATKVGVFQIISGGNTDSGAIDIYTKNTGVAVAQAIRINKDQTTTFYGGITAPSGIISGTAFPLLTVNRASGNGNNAIEFDQASVAKAYFGLSGTGQLITGMADGDFGIRAQSKGIYMSTDGGTTAHFKIAATTGAITAISAIFSSTLAASNLSGTNTGDQTSVSGNAGTVTNGVYTTDTGTVTNTMLAGSISNSKLANGAVANLSGTNTGDQTNISGNAATVTTNANLTGPVTSTGNATAIANGAISNAMLANSAVANLSGTNTGDNATNTQYSGLITNAITLGKALVMQRGFACQP